MALGHTGVLGLLVYAQHGLVGPTETPVDVSYLADAVVLLRSFEADGEVRQAVSVVKKRGGRHERTIREFGLGPGGLRIGEPLRQFAGVLTGVPTDTGPAGPLLESRGS
jgi:circadian clock protein KaiC